MSVSGGWENVYASHGTAGLWSDTPIPCIEEAVRTIVGRKATSVLDVGCGDGRNLVSLVDAGLTCVGVDVSPSALKSAISRLRGRAILVLDDAVDLSSFPNGSIDAITCFDFFGQVATPERMLESFRRVLGPAGLLYLNVYSTDDSEYGRGEAVGQDTFRYGDTIFRYYGEEELRHLLSAWDILTFGRLSWEDQPHGEFRPYVHRHDSWLISALNS